MERYSDKLWSLSGWVWGDGDGQAPRWAKHSFGCMWGNGDGLRIESQTSTWSLSGCVWGDGDGEGMERDGETPRQVLGACLDEFEVMQMDWGSNSTQTSTWSLSGWVLGSFQLVGSLMLIKHQRWASKAHSVLRYYGETDTHKSYWGVGGGVAGTLLNHLLLEVEVQK